MTKFIWVRDCDKVEHYINVDHIVRVTKIPAHGVYGSSTYLVLKDDRIYLSQDEFDTYEEVISKIQSVL